MYAKCESIEDAWRVFNKMPSQNVVSWTPHNIGSCEMWARTEGTAAILTNAGKRCAAKLCYFCGGVEGICQHACTCHGRCVHEQIIESGCSDVIVGSIEDAWPVFKKMPFQDVVTWTTMILGHVKCGQGQNALELF
jgi:pentatricopeptide repeat protein